MRRLGFILTLIAAIPALVLPLLTIVAALAAPAALIAGIAAMSFPAERGDGRGNPQATIRTSKFEVRLARSDSNHGDRGRR